MEGLPDVHRPTGKLASIQFLRALAAILVIYDHSLDIQSGFGASRQQRLFHNLHTGAIGVDIFFVISGFIITWSAGKWLGRREGRRFLYNRFVRLVPLYWIATLLFFVLQVHHMLVTGGLPTLPVYIKTILLLPVIDKAHFIWPLMFVAWTLSFEWLFYLLFFALILLSVRRKTLVLSLVILGAVFAGRLFRPASVQFVFLTNPMMLEFLLGVWICAVYSSLKVRRMPSGLLVVAAIGMILYEMKTGHIHIYWVDKILTGEWAMIRVLLWGIPSAMLVAGCVLWERNGSARSVFNNRFIILLGDASYSMYLIHIIIFGLITAVYTRVGFFLNGDLAVFLQLFAAIAGGVLFYRWVEVPLLRKLRPSRPHSAPPKA